MRFFSFFRQTLPFILPYKWKSLLIVLLISIPITFSLIVPLSLKWIFDYAIAEKNSELMWSILFGLLAGLIITTLANLLRSYLTAVFSASVIQDIRLKLFSHLQKLSMRFYTKTAHGDLISRFTNDLTAVDRIMTSVLFDSVFFILLFLISTAMLFVIEWHLALVTFLSMPLFLLVTNTLGPKAVKSNDEKKEQEAKVVARVQENTHSHMVIRSFDLQSIYLEKFKRQTAILRKHSILSNFLSVFIEKGILLTVALIQILIISAGAFLVIHGYLTHGALVAFVGLLINIVESVSALTKGIPDIFQGMSGMQRITDILAEKPDIANADNAINLSKFVKKIEFQDIAFSYTGEKNQLDNINLKISKGHSVAFVGTSGSGKSTVLNLLMRFYEPLQGNITVDSHNLEQLAIESWHAQIGIVFQESILFNTTVFENILLGNLNADKSMIVDAAHKAELHEFIETLPNGYDTLLGESGVQLSGGQRQRLALARAIVRNPSILILDEATSALDSETEAAINQTLKKLSSERTVISITHRLGLIADYDFIYVLDQGKIAEQGVHNALIAQQGIYHKLWYKQSGFKPEHKGEGILVTAQRLQETSIFAKLDMAFLEQISPFFITEYSEADQTIIREGDSGDSFYMIVRGSVAVLKRNDEGQQIRISVLQDGDFFGEIALLKKIPRIATVKTLTNCTFLLLKRWQFLHIVDQTKHIQCILEKETSARFESASRFDRV